MKKTVSSVKISFLLLIVFCSFSAQASVWHFGCKVWYENADINGDGTMSLNDYILYSDSIESASNPCTGSLCSSYWGADLGYGAVTDVVLDTCYEGDDAPPPETTTCPAPYLDPTGTPATCSANYSIQSVIVGASTLSCCKLNTCGSCPAPCMAISTGATKAYIGGVPVPVAAQVGCMNTTTLEVGACGTCPTTPLTCGDMSLYCIAPIIQVGCY